MSSSSLKPFNNFPLSSGEVQTFQHAPTAILIWPTSPPPPVPPSPPPPHPDSGLQSHPTFLRSLNRPHPLSRPYLCTCFSSCLEYYSRASHTPTLTFSLPSTSLPFSSQLHRASCWKHLFTYPGRRPLRVLSASEPHADWSHPSALLCPWQGAPGQHRSCSALYPQVLQVLSRHLKGE